jgi:ubiquitin fusion degradation protein 1
LETRPGDAVSIIECDMDVDFAPPVGYQEPDYKAQAQAEKAAKAVRENF